jgi:hypothetical protein
MLIALTEVRAVRIVCDDYLKARLLEHLTQMGATGYTWWSAHGQGDHPTETGFLKEQRRVYIEAWCNLEVAEKILTYCLGNEFRSVGMAVGVTSLLVPADDAAQTLKG